MKLPRLDVVACQLELWKVEQEDEVAGPRSTGGTKLLWLCRCMSGDWITVTLGDRPELRQVQKGYVPREPQPPPAKI